jgi:hypothetical protein
LFSFTKALKKDEDAEKDEDDVDEQLTNETRKSTTSNKPIFNERGSKLE